MAISAGRCALPAGSRHRPRPPRAGQPAHARLARELGRAPGRSSGACRAAQRAVLYAPAGGAVRAVRVAAQRRAARLHRRSRSTTSSHTPCACLRSLAQHRGHGCRSRSIVVDDRSSDETVDAAAAGRRHALALRNDENLGFIGACNAGAAHARGEFLVFLNNDTAVQPGWLEALLRHVRRASRLRPRRREARLSRRPPAGSRRHRVLRRLGLELRPLRAIRRIRATTTCAKPTTARGAAIMVPRALFEQLGGFDTRYAPAYYEDTDLAFRVRERGLKALLPAGVGRRALRGRDVGHRHRERHQALPGRATRRSSSSAGSDALPPQPRPGTPIDAGVASTACAARC